MNKNRALTSNKLLWSKAYREGVGLYKVTPTHDILLNKEVFKVINNFKGNFAKVRSFTKRSTGFINREGKIIIPLEYNMIVEL